MLFELNGFALWYPDPVCWYQWYLWEDGRQFVASFLANFQTLETWQEQHEAGWGMGNHGWDCEIPVCWHIFFFQYCFVYCGGMILLEQGSAGSVELFELHWQKNRTSESRKCCFYSSWQDIFFLSDMFKVYLWRKPSPGRAENSWPNVESRRFERTNRRPFPCSV